MVPNKKCFSRVFEYRLNKSFECILKDKEGLAANKCHDKIIVLSMLENFNDVQHLGASESEKTTIYFNLTKPGDLKELKVGFECCS
jgi:hypothetical protein